MDVVTQADGPGNDGDRTARERSASGCEGMPTGGEQIVKCAARRVLTEK